MVPAGRKGAIAGSPAAPSLNEAVPGGGPYGPAHAAAWPVVRTIPPVIASKVAVEVNFPFATAGQVSEGDKIVTPGPASVDASIAAGCDVVTTNCEYVLLYERTRRKIRR